MKAHFYSISKNSNVKYISDLKIDNNTYSFKDSDNTFINLSILNNNHIIINRFGSISMDMVFKTLEKTKSFYKNDMGLEFDLEIFTKDISISKDKIVIEYDLYLDNILNDSYKIFVLIK